MDNAPYHCKEHNKAPTRSDNKQVMVDWLNVNGFDADMSMRKTVLYDNIELRRPREKVFKIDQLFNAHGHSVLRLPPYMCELNAIELAWAKLKNFVRSKNVGGDINMTRLREIVLEGLNQITTEDWMGYCSHVQKIEEEHWERDGIVENALESIIIDLDTSDEESDDEEEEKDVGVPSC